MLDLVEATEHRLIGEVIQLLPAEIIVAALHVADGETRVRVTEESLLEEWHVFVEELFLQIFRSRRDDDALARTNHGHEIRQCLAGSGAGLDYQVAFLFQRLLDCLGHLQLSAAKFIRRMRPRKHTARPKELVQRSVFAAGRGTVRGG